MWFSTFRKVHVVILMLFSSLFINVGSRTIILARKSTHSITQQATLDQTVLLPPYSYHHFNIEYETPWTILQLSQNSQIVACARLLLGVVPIGSCTSGRSRNPFQIFFRDGSFYLFCIKWMYALEWFTWTKDCTGHPMQFPFSDSWLRDAFLLHLAPFCNLLCPTLHFYPVIQTLSRHHLATHRKHKLSALLRTYRRCIW